MEGWSASESYINTVERILALSPIPFIQKKQAVTILATVLM
jgi:hypothetical protein